MWLLTVVSYAYIIVPTSVMPLIRDSLLVGPLAASLVLSVTLAAQSVSNVPVGMALDRVHNVRVLGWATGGLLLAGVWGWYAASSGAYWSLLCSRALGGVATVAMWTAGINVTTGLYRFDRRATAIGFFTTSAPTGFAFGQFTGPILASPLGWAGTFVAYSAATAAVFVIVFFAAVRCSVPSSPVTDAPTPEQFRATLVDGRVWRIAVLAFVAYSTFLVLNNWMPSYLIDEFDLSLVRSGAFVALFPAMGVLARSGGGVLSDRWLAGRRQPVILASFAVATPAIIVLSVAREPISLLLTLCLAGLGIQLGIGVFYVYVREMVDASVSATAVSVTSAVAIMGATTGPIITGALFEYSGTYASVFGYAVVLSALGVILARTAPEPSRLSQSNVDA